MICPTPPDFSGASVASLKQLQGQQNQSSLGWSRSVKPWISCRRKDAAIRLEQLWNDVGKTFGLDILCGYDLSSFHGEEDERVFQSICAEHSAVYSQ
jgi:hypothetical protein